jgi:hypothetical protein
LNKIGTPLLLLCIIFAKELAFKQSIDIKKCFLSIDKYFIGRPIKNFLISLQKNNLIKNNI